MDARTYTRERTGGNDRHGAGFDIEGTAPLVSVLIPAFNHERFIGRCLDSILSDGYRNTEIVIVNDGSGDATHEVAQEWIRQHGNRIAGGVRLLQQDNRGVVRTLNRLVSEARGEFITVLASDDCLCRGSIGARVDYLLAHPKHLAVFGDAAGIDEDDNLVLDSVLQERYFASSDALRCDATRGLELILRWSVPGPVYLARRRVAQEIGPYDERYCFEDRNYYLRLINANALGFIDRRVAFYRLQNTSTTTRFSQIKRDFARVQEDLLDEFHGLKRLALGILVALDRLDRKGERTILKGVTKRVLFRLRKRMIQGNRRIATLLLHGTAGGSRLWGLRSTPDGSLQGPLATGRHRAITKTRDCVDECVSGTPTGEW